MRSNQPKIHHIPIDRPRHLEIEIAHRRSIVIPGGTEFEIGDGILFYSYENTICRQVRHETIRRITGITDAGEGICDGFCLIEFDVAYEDAFTWNSSTKEECTLSFIDGVLLGTAGMGLIMNVLFFFIK